MPPKDLLDLEARKRIVELIGRSPGLHMRALAEQLEMAVSTLEYHCYQLQRHGHVTTREEGGYKAYYPAEGIDRRDKNILYLVRQEMPRRVCAHLLLHPGATPKDVRTELGCSAPTLSFHLKKMLHAGLLREEPAGRTKYLFVEDDERVANVLVTYRKSFVDDVVDRFTAAWSELRPPVTAPAAQEGENPPPPSVSDLMSDDPEEPTSEPPAEDAKLADAFTTVLRGAVQLLRAALRGAGAASQGLQLRRRQSPPRCPSAQTAR